MFKNVSQFYITCNYVIMNNDVLDANLIILTKEYGCSFQMLGS